jgi:hypothetical protein
VIPDNPIHHVNSDIDLLSDITNDDRFEELEKQYNKLINSTIDSVILKSLAIFKAKLENFESKYRCPINFGIMDEPVTLPSGKSYEKESIYYWLSTGKEFCPLTTKPVPNIKYETAGLLDDYIKEKLKKFDEKLIVIAREIDQVNLRRYSFCNSFRKINLAVVDESVREVSEVIEGLNVRHRFGVG